MTEFPEWVDGKAFAAWLEGRRPDLRSALTDSQCRTLYRLRIEGGAGSLDVVDRLCVRLNIHINEIPEWIWTETPRFGQNRREYPPETREKAMRMLRTGRSMRDAATILDLPLETVKTWKRRDIDGKE